MLVFIAILRTIQAIPSSQYFINRFLLAHALSIATSKPSIQNIAQVCRDTARVRCVDLMLFNVGAGGGV